MPTSALVKATFSISQGRPPVATLLVGSSGNEPTQENNLHLIHAAAGDAQFALVNGAVGLGAFSYGSIMIFLVRGASWV